MLQTSWNSVIFDDPPQRVRVAFPESPAGEFRIELVEPAGADSPVRRFLQQRGGGLHHIYYGTGDVEAELRRMRSERAILVQPPKPAVAFDRRRIAWMLTPEKLLVELIEKNLPASRSR